MCNTDAEGHRPVYTDQSGSQPEKSAHAICLHVISERLIVFFDKVLLSMDGSIGGLFLLVKGYVQQETRPFGSGKENQTDADDEDKAQDDLLEKAGGDAFVEEISPAVDGISLERVLRKVVLLQPVGPTMLRNSPSPTLKEISSRTRRSPNRFVRFLISIFVFLASLPSTLSSLQRLCGRRPPDLQVRRTGPARRGHDAASNLFLGTRCRIVSPRKGPAAGRRLQEVALSKVLLIRIFSAAAARPRKDR